MSPAKNLALTLAFAIVAATQAVAQNQPTATPPEKPGIKAVQSPLTNLKPIATLNLGGDPDWLAISENAVWVTNDKLKSVQRIDPRTNTLVAKIEFPSEPCSGLAFAFNSLWVPLCGQPASLARVDPATNKITATLPVGPADNEGGITASEYSLWIISDANGTLLRVDPASHTVRQKIAIPPGSFNPVYSDGIVWVTGNQSSVLTPVNARSGEVLPSIPVGPNPRFLTAGDGSIWTLNQGDGSVTRISAKTRQVIATIPAGIPGLGGQITYDANSVWATVIGIPLTQISPVSNQVIRQYTGSGGDSVCLGHHSLWLTHLRGGLLWRIALPQP
jgi:virginiamycin B lyase